MNIQSRFSDAPWLPQGEEAVLVGGAGGIGSWLTFFLARAGFTPYVYDDDVVEQHNLGGQLFSSSYIGSPKVKALAQTIKHYCDIQIGAYNERFTQDSTAHYFAFSAFDNMEARKVMFNKWKEASKNITVTPLFIDGRLLAEQLQIFCVTPENADRYEEHLFDDSEVEDGPCSFKQTSHVAAMIASHMFGFFTNHMANIYTRETFRDVPFYYEFYVPVSLTNIES